MKVLVLNGSPRPKGNTSKMTAAFKEAAEAAGHDIREFKVAAMNIGGCLACEYCHTKGNGASLPR
jgi:multimeric flavodoxin WrbA